MDSMVIQWRDERGGVTTTLVHLSGLLLIAAVGGACVGAVAMAKLCHNKTKNEATIIVNNSHGGGTFDNTTTICKKGGAPRGGGGGGEHNKNQRQQEEEETRRRLEQILSFLREADKLKLVERTVYLTGGHKKEDSAQHSWHLAVMYMTLQTDLPLFNKNNVEDRWRMLQMLLVHDLVEVYAGDTPLLENVTITAEGLLVEDDQKWIQKQKEESAAAERLFSLLPQDMNAEFRGLWEEFETGTTHIAKVAKGLDKLHCLVQNSCCNGMDYKAYKSTYDQEMSLIKKYVDFDPTLKLVAEMVLGDAQKQGWI